MWKARRNFGINTTVTEEVSGIPTEEVYIRDSQL